MSEIEIRVEAEFECTFDDYKEALTPIVPSARRGGRRRHSWVATGWILFIFLALVLFGVLTKEPPPAVPVSASQSAPGEQLSFRVSSDSVSARSMARFAIAMFPTVLMCVSVVLFSVPGKSAMPAAPWSGEPPATNSRWTTLGGLLMMAAVVTAVVGLVGWRSPSDAPNLGLKPSAVEWILGVEPMLLIILSFITLTKIQRKTLLRTQWNAQPSLHRRHRIEADAMGMNLIEPRSRHEYQWASLLGYRETASLILIYISFYAHWMIPKRAFVDPLDLDRFKGLLMNHIPDGYLLQKSGLAFQISTQGPESEIPFAQVSPGEPPAEPRPPR